MVVHKTASCRYCADRVDVEWLDRHEAKCKTRTDEERTESRRHRSEARERYRASMRVPAAPKKNDIRRATDTCRYCHDKIGAGQMDKHTVVCAKRTPAERAEAAESRVRQREYSRTHWLQQKQLQVAKKSHHAQSVWVNGNGRRLSATISIDFKSFREMLLQLAPMLSIDKVEVV